MNMKKLIALIIITLLCTACASSGGPPYIKEIAALTKVPGLGATFVIPDEDGWMFFDPDGKGSMLVKHGKSKIESYVISLDRYTQPAPESVEEFHSLYRMLKNKELGDPRYKVISAIEKPINSRGNYFIEFHYLVEDYKASNMPKSTEYMLLETMGFFTVNPETPDNLARVSYSHRYLPNNKDGNFKEKAGWVLENVNFVPQ
jgi:hypothetical protein